MHALWLFLLSLFSFHGVTLRTFDLCVLCVLCGLAHSAALRQFAGGAKDCPRLKQSPQRILIEKADDVRVGTIIVEGVTTVEARNVRAAITFNMRQAALD